MQKLMPKSFFFGILILSLLIVFVTNWSYFQEKYSPISDTAVNSIRIHKAMEFKELLGPYSRFNYNNLGPTAFYYYALMNKILFFVQDESGRFAMAQLFLNFCFLFWATYIIFIHTKSVNKTLLFFILFILSIIHLSNDVLSSIWGPHTIIIPFLLLIVSFVSVIENNFYSLIPFTISSTFMAHQHLSVMVIIVPFYIFIFFMIFKKRNKIPIKPVVVSITIFVLLNTLPVIEQLTSNEGNLSKIFKFIFQPKNKTQTFGRAIEYVFSYFGDPLNFLKIDPLYIILFNVL